MKKTAVENNRPEPIYNPLPNTESVLQRLLDLQPMTSNFVPVSFRESLEGLWPMTEEDFFEDIGVQASEKNYQQFCEQMVLEQRSPQRTTIPQIIHIIWLGSEPTPCVNLVIKSWKKHHPNWEIKIWRDKDIEKLNWTTSHSKEFFEQSGNWSEKSDILRFEILYQFGGVYTDTDMVCLKSFESLTSSGISFFAGFESNKIKRFGRPLIGSALIGAQKNHEILRHCIDFSLTIDQAPETRQYIRSGPGPITKASYEALEKNENQDVIIFPCSFFYPLHWEGRLEFAEKIPNYIRPESYSVHLWEGSWYDSFGEKPKEEIPSLK